MDRIDTFLSEYGFLVILAAVAYPVVPVFAAAMVVGSVLGWPGLAMLRGGMVGLLLAALVAPLLGGLWFWVVGIAVIAGMSIGGLDGREHELLRPSEAEGAMRLRFSPA